MNFSSEQERNEKLSFLDVECLMKETNVLLLLVTYF